MDKKLLFKEVDNRLLNDPAPSAYLNELLARGHLDQYPYTMLSGLKAVKQSPQHHPEGDVWNHTLMVVDIAAENKDRSKDRRVFMWSALLHDLGKLPATRIRRGRITAYDHDKLGAGLAQDFLMDLQEDEAFAERVRAMVRWHMQVLFVVKGLPFADIKGMLADLDLDEIALLCYCDRMGRGGMDREKRSKEEENIQKFISLVASSIPKASWFID